MSKSQSLTVWTSGQGDLRRNESGAQTIISLPPQQQTVYLHRDSKGRGGKRVTFVKKLVLSEDDVKELAKKLKQVCGNGVAVKLRWSVRVRL